MGYQQHKFVGNTFNDAQYLEAYNELFGVFKFLWFENLKIKRQIESSYFANLCQMINYANDNNLDVKEYIRGIRDILLQSPYVHVKE